MSNVMETRKGLPSRSSSALSVKDDQEICKTEDAVRAFMEYLVDPLIPAKASVFDNPSLSQQQSVAKQVHAVVVLYNYYHRKQHRHLEFLSFEAFCKLLVLLKPPLLTYMKFMQKNEDTELDDLEKQLAVTEKTIMDACDICTGLDASKDTPNIEQWPISKVAVFLVDSSKKKCLLRFGDVTQGVWSLLEKDLGVSSQISEDRGEAKSSLKRRITKRPIRNDSCIDEGGMRQLALSLVTESTGINQTDLLVLDSHVVYSSSKAKSASRFYIVQCLHTASQSAVLVPIKDAFVSMLGPLVKRTDYSWMASPVVEYFHVLPYAEIMLDWFSREASPDSLLEDAVRNVKRSRKEGPKPQNNDNKNKSSLDCDMTDCVDKQDNSASDIPVTVDKSERRLTRDQYDNIDNIDIPQNSDIHDCSVPAHKKYSSIQRTIFSEYSEEKDTSLLEKDLKDLTNDGTGESTVPLHISQCSGNQNAAVIYISNNPLNQDLYPANNGALDHSADAVNGNLNQVNNGTLLTHWPTKDLEKIYSIIASKEKEISEAALTVLFRKRAQLILQQRTIQDEIAQYDMNIHKIRNGDQDALPLKLESIINGCHDVFRRDATLGRTDKHLVEQNSAVCGEEGMLDAIAHTNNLCKELDEICNEKNWILPAYHISISKEGKFLATVTLKGMDMEYSSDGDPHTTPREARESAAGHMLGKLGRSLITVE